MRLQPIEGERMAYAEGFTMAAELFKRIDDLEAERNALTQKIANLEDVETLQKWKDKNGDPEEYKQFFFDCFEWLAKHYPYPDVSSDYDKSVIFDAIEKGADE